MHSLEWYESWALIEWILIQYYVDQRENGWGESWACLPIPVS
jgi:hypothetical protein